MKTQLTMVQKRRDPLTLNFELSNDGVVWLRAKATRADTGVPGKVVTLELSTGGVVKHSMLTREEAIRFAHALETAGFQQVIVNYD